MQKKLLAGLLWVLTLNLIIKPVWLFVIEIGVQNAIGTESYGLYFGLFNIAYIFNILLDLGITNYNTRYSAQHPALIAKYFPAALTMKLLLLLVYIAVTIGFGIALGYRSEAFMLLLLLCINQFLSSLIIFLRSNFEGLLLFRADSIISVLDRLLMIIFCGGLLVYSKSMAVEFQLMWFVLSQTVAYLITAVVSFILLTHHIQLRKLRLRLSFSIAILKKSFPFALLVLLMASYNRLDPIMLQLLLPPDIGKLQSGIFAGGYRLLDAMTMIAYLASVPLLPIFSKMTKKLSTATEVNELHSTTQMMFSLLIVYSVIVATILSATSDNIIALLYRHDGGSIASVLSLLIFSLIPISITYVYGTLLTANGSLKLLNTLAAVALLMNIGSNMLLIPRFGARGAAIAGLIAQSFMALSQMIASYKTFHFRWHKSKAIKLMAFIAVTVVINIICCNLQMGLLLHLGVVAILALVTAFTLQIIDIKEIVQTIKTRNTLPN